MDESAEQYFATIQNQLAALSQFIQELSEKLTEHTSITASAIEQLQNVGNELEEELRKRDEFIELLTRQGLAAFSAIQQGKT